jgi:uncharacterized protein (DUF433 family)
MKDAHGVIRVGGARVTLDTIFYAFLEGATPEEVMQRYPSLNLADIYAVFSYCANFQQDMAEYVREQETLAAAVRRSNEERFPPHGIRERLLARRTVKN